MTPRDPVASLLPWYGNGTLDAAARHQVEEHLTDCADCRALLQEIRALAPMGRQDPTDLLEHVHAQHLEQHARRGPMPQELLRWMEEHLRRCGACRAAHEVLQAEMGISEAAGREGGLWSWLSRTLLHPLAAAAYLLLLVAVLTLWRGGTGAPPSARGGAVDLPVLSSPLRGGASRVQVHLETDPVLLAVELDWSGSEEPPGPAVRFVLEGEGGAVWETDVTAQRLAHNLQELGLVVLAVPRRQLSPGTFRLTARWTGGSEGVLLDTTFQATE